MRLLDILLVDDDQDDCTLFDIAVERTGLNICLQTVTDGDQAIDYLEGRGVYADRLGHPVPDLVVLDGGTGLAGGFDFLEWRRATAAFSSLPVVIFSGYTHEGAMDMALAMGANTFIAKPHGFEKLKAVVRRIWALGMEWKGATEPAFALCG
jgi:DNA-binding response OmpR family regulator